MSYKKVGWKNYPDTSTPINATNLDHMDSQIQVNANAVDKLNENVTSVKLTADSAVKVAASNLTFSSLSLIHI